LGTYTVPRIDVQLAGTFQSIPGPQLSATLVVPCGAGTAVAAQLGRNCTAAGGSYTLNILAPGTLFGDRLYQTDFRIGKIIRFGGNRRATASVDLYNMFNGRAVLQQGSTYPTTATSAPYAQPTSLQQARFVKFTLVTSF